MLPTTNMTLEKNLHKKRDSNEQDFYSRIQSGQGMSKSPAGSKS